MGGGGGFHWAGLPQLPVHRSQWKFIFLIRHVSFRVRLDSMLKLIRNYINPNGFAVCFHDIFHILYPYINSVVSINVHSSGYFLASLVRGGGG
jgi:hypothetical protein